MTPDHIMAVKHRWKRRKFWLPQFSAFPTMFSKDLVLSVVKTQDFVAKSYHAIAKREKLYLLFQSVLQPVVQPFRPEMFCA